MGILLPCVYSSLSALELTSLFLKMSGTRMNTGILARSEPPVPAIFHGIWGRIPGWDAPDRSGRSMARGARVAPGATLALHATLAPRARVAPRAMHICPKLHVQKFPLHQ
jgi:hypothetical protein